MLPNKEAIVSSNPDSSSPKFNLSTPMIFGSTIEASITNEKLDKNSDIRSSCLSLSSGIKSIIGKILSQIRFFAGNVGELVESSW